MFVSGTISAIGTLAKRISKPGKTYQNTTTYNEIHLNMVKLLIENGATLNGHTECRIAIIKGYHKIGDYLIRKKQELDTI